MSKQKELVPSMEQLEVVRAIIQAQNQAQKAQNLESKSAQNDQKNKKNKK